MAAGHGGQTLLSAAAADRVRAGAAGGNDAARPRARTSCAESRKRRTSTSSSPRTCRRRFRRCGWRTSPLPIPRRFRSWCAGNWSAAASESAAAARALGQRAAGTRAAGAAFGRAGRGQDAAGAGSRCARAEERRDAAARRMLRVRGHHAVPALRRGVPRVDAPAEPGAAARGARRDRAGNRQVRARDRGQAGHAHAQCAAVAQRGADAPVRQRRALPAAAWRPSAACWCSSTTCTGRTRARCRCCITCCVTCATTACSSWSRTARSNSTARIRWPAALVEWNRERLGTRIALGRLTRADTGTLLATLFGVTNVSDDLAEALYRETEGNPFFVEEVIKSLIEQGEIYRDGDRWGRKETHELAIPQSVKEAIGRRLDAADRADRGRAAHGRRARQGLSVPGAGRRFRGGRGRAARRARRGDRRAADPREQRRPGRVVRGRRRQLRVHARQDPRSALRGAESRSAAAGCTSASARRWRRLYDASVRDGEATGPGADQHAQDLAHHFMQAGDLPRSLAYAQRAARNATRVFALDEALKFLDQARESAEALHRDDDARAHRRADRRHSRIARNARNPRSTVTSVRSPARRAPDARAALKAKIGSVYCQVGDARGLPYLEEALAELDPATQTNELALSTAFMGRYYHYRTEHRKAIEFLERARQLAEPLDDAATLGAIYSFLAGAHQHLLAYAESDRLGAQEHRIRRAQEFPALRSPTATSSWRRMPPAAVFGTMRSPTPSATGSSARRAGRWRAWPGPDLRPCRRLHGKGELAAARPTARGDAGAVRADRRRPARDLARTHARHRRGGPGR